MPQNMPFVNPTHQILLSPADARKREFEIGPNATAAKMIPGTIVVTDTFGKLVKEAGDEPHEYIGILDCATDMAITDHYNLGDQVMVIVGECYCLVRMNTGENITYEDRLGVTTDGIADELGVGVLGAQGASIGFSLEDSGGALAAVTHMLIHFIPEVEEMTA